MKSSVTRQLYIFLFADLALLPVYIYIYTFEIALTTLISRLYYKCALPPMSIFCRSLTRRRFRWQCLIPAAATHPRVRLHYNDVVFVYSYRSHRCYMKISSVNINIITIRLAEFSQFLNN